MKIYFLFIIFTFSRCLRGAICDDPRFLRLGLFAAEEGRVLYIHNLMRSRVYTGYETRGSNGPQPAAKFDKSLKWDKSLEKQAEDWVKECYKSNDFKKLSGANYGQIVIKADFREPAPYDWALQQLENFILTWYNEVEKFNGSEVSKFNPNTSQLSLNYTQIIWGATTRIGCSAIRFREVETLTPQIFFACNYSPKGNIENQPVNHVERLGYSLLLTGSLLKTALAKEFKYKVVQYLENRKGRLVKRERSWTEHFLNTVNPKLLPELWSVCHNQERLSIRQIQNNNE